MLYSFCFSTFFYFLILQLFFRYLCIFHLSIFINSTLFLILTLLSSNIDNFLLIIFVLLKFCVVGLLFIFSGYFLLNRSLLKSLIISGSGVLLFLFILLISSFFIIVSVSLLFVYIKLFTLLSSSFNLKDSFLFIFIKLFLSFSLSFNLKDSKLLKVLFFISDNKLFYASLSFNNISSF